MKIRKKLELMSRKRCKRLYEECMDELGETVFIKPERLNRRVKKYGTGRLLPMMLDGKKASFNSPKLCLMQEVVLYYNWFIESGYHTGGEIFDPKVAVLGYTYLDKKNFDRPLSKILHSLLESELLTPEDVLLVSKGGVEGALSYSGSSKKEGDLLMDDWYRVPLKKPDEFTFNTEKNGERLEWSQKEDFLMYVFDELAKRDIRVVFNDNPASYQRVSDAFEELEQGMIEYQQKSPRTDKDYPDTRPYVKALISRISNCTVPSVLRHASDSRRVYQVMAMEELFMGRELQKSLQKKSVPYAVIVPASDFVSDLAQQ